MVQGWYTVFYFSLSHFCIILILIMWQIILENAMTCQADRECRDGACRVRGDSIWYWKGVSTQDENKENVLGCSPRHVLLLSVGALGSWQHYGNWQYNFSPPRTTRIVIWSEAEGGDGNMELEGGGVCVSVSGGLWKILMKKREGNHGWITSISKCQPLFQMENK